MVPPPNDSADPFQPQGANNAVIEGLRYLVCFEVRVVTQEVDSITLGLDDESLIIATIDRSGRLVLEGDDLVPREHSVEPCKVFAVNLWGVPAPVNSLRVELCFCREPLFAFRMFQDGSCSRNLRRTEDADRRIPEMVTGRNVVMVNRESLAQSDALCSSRVQSKDPFMPTLNRR